MQILCCSNGAHLVGRGLLLMVSTRRVMITGLPMMLQLEIIACAERHCQCCWSGSPACHLWAMTVINRLCKGEIDAQWTAIRGH